MDSPGPAHRGASRAEVLTSPSGAVLLDFGQNLVGRLRVSVEGPAGTRIVLRHAEVLEDGELGTRPLRSAKAKDEFVLSGEGIDDFEARVHLPRIPVRGGDSRPPR